MSITGGLFKDGSLGAYAHLKILHWRRSPSGSRPEEIAPVLSSLFIIISPINSNIQYPSLYRRHSILAKRPNGHPLYRKTLMSPYRARPTLQLITLLVEDRMEIRGVQEYGPSKRPFVNGKKRKGHDRIFRSAVGKRRGPKAERGS